MSEVIDAGVAGAFDPEAVGSLTGHADDRELALALVARYRRMLPERVGRIRTALAERDLDEAMDAVLSLKVSSCTLGASELSQLGGRIEGHLRRLDLARAVAVADELAATAERADRALTAYLDA